MLYLTWRVHRLNFELFQAMTGMAFLSIVLMTPASPGWFVWCLPFLALYQAKSGRMAMLLVGVFSGVYLLSTLLVTQLQFANGYELTLSSMMNASGKLGIQLASLLHTAMVAIGLVLMIRIWREAINKNDFFRLSRKPFVLGISGDSGAGKDTFADAITGLFGNHSVVKLSGDDYHLWDRQKHKWQVMTHLNPMANDLERFSNDLISLIDGKSILSRHYDHKIGKLSKPFRMESNELIIASGLHALYLPVLRECYNLKIYLDIDEKLRRYFKLNRDVHQRGHLVDQILDSFDKREPDSQSFIRPQSIHADLILSLQPIHPQMLENLENTQTLRLKLVVNTKNGFNEISIHRILVGVCGLHVDMLIGHTGSDVQMTIEGEASAADIAMSAQMLCPNIIEFLDLKPKWQDGMLGLMQLITLSHINQALTKRFI
jgi:uridine kinase